MLLLFLYALWILFNGRITTDVALIGIPVAAGVWMLTLKMLGSSVRKDFALLRRLPEMAAFLWFLLWDVIASAVRVMRFIWQPRKTEPQLVRLDPRLRTKTGRVLWADSVTLTPGTLTVELGEDSSLVHCLDASLGDGLEESRMLQRVRAMEEGGRSHG